MTGAALTARPPADAPIRMEEPVWEPGGSRIGGSREFETPVSAETLQGNSPEVGTEGLPGKTGHNLWNLLKDKEREGMDQLRADALGLVAEAALGQGLGSRHRGEPFQVLLHVDAEVLVGTEQEGRCELEAGTGVCAETARRIACDAPVRGVLHGVDGSELDAGRKTRRISARLWRVLQERDGRCRFPACRRNGRLEAHHIQHWAHGGEANPGNTVLLCRFHHRTVHEGGYRIRGDAGGGLTFVRPDGSELPEVPSRPAVPSDPMKALMDRNRQEGVRIDAETTRTGWFGEGLDLVSAVEAILWSEGAM